MERREGRMAQEAILEGYRDFDAGRSFASTGSFAADMAQLDKREAEVERLKSKR